MAHYLVTGGCGFIGSHLCEALLARGDRVRILDDLSTGKLENKPKNAELVRGDIADPATVEQAMKAVDGCFHLAAVASVEKANRDSLGTHRSNLTGTITVFDAASRARGGQAVPVVYASSAAVYGDNVDMPLSEVSATRPLSAYGADKSITCRRSGSASSTYSGRGRIRNRHIPASSRSSPIGCAAVAPSRSSATAGRRVTSSMSATPSSPCRRRCASCRRAVPPLISARGE